MIKNFLIFCSGASKNLLLQCPESDQTKYVGLGGTVLFTSLFAFASSTYAFYVISKDPKFSIFFGVVWGLMILNLDRYLISSVTQLGKDGFLSFVPRILLGLLISATLAHPIELLIFESEINQYLNQEKTANYDAAREKYKKQSDELTQGRNSQIKLVENRAITSELQRSLLLAEKELASKRVRANQAEERSLCECDGTCGTGKRGNGPECKRKTSIYNELKREELALSSSLRELKLSHESMLEKNSKDMALIESKFNLSLEGVQKLQSDELGEIGAHFSDSLYSRTKALYKLVERDNLYIFVYLIYSLFIVIELAPIISKLIQPRGVYEELLAAEKKNAQQLNDSFNRSIFKVDLGSEVESHSKNVKKTINSILENSMEKVDIANHEERAANHFDDLYKNFIRSVSITEGRQSKAINPAPSGFALLPILSLIVITMVATFVPYVYLSGDMTVPIEAAADTGLASGALTLSLLVALLSIKKT